MIENYKPEFDWLKQSYKLPSSLRSVFSCDSTKTLDAPPQHGKFSSVCMLFVPADSPGDDVRILLTRRSKLIRSHRHQIGFPGGKNEPGESIFLTALRETEEEVGIAREFIRPFAYRSPNFALNGDPVYTILAESTVNEAQLIANTNEVEEIILIPWTELAKSKCQEFSFNIFGIWRQSALFKTTYCNIWGLTANIISDYSLE